MSAESRGLNEQLSIKGEEVLDFSTMQTSDPDQTGGQAFPSTWNSSHNANVMTTEGMSLLDYFAAKALPEVMRSMQQQYLASDGTIADSEYRRAAQYSYRLSVAMIEERKKYITP